MNHVYLIGFMGAGKSTVGRIISRDLGLPFVDLDARIEKAERRSVREIFEDQGEEGFRGIESRALEALASEPRAVVACGGGVVLRDENRLTLKRTGRVVYLKVSAAEAVARVGGSDTRPLLSGASGAVAATSLLAAREALYEAVSDFAIDTSGLSAEEVAAEVVSSGVVGERS